MLLNNIKYINLIITGLEKGANDYLTKPFRAKELIARVYMNIKLSYLYKRLLIQEYQQYKIKKILFTILNKVHLKYNLQETLTIAIKKIHKYLLCDEILIISNDSIKIDKGTIIVFSTKINNKKNLLSEKKMPEILQFYQKYHN